MGPEAEESPIEREDCRPPVDPPNKRTNTSPACTNSSGVRTPFSASADSERVGKTLSAAALYVLNIVLFQLRQPPRKSERARSERSLSMASTSQSRT